MNFTERQVEQYEILADVLKNFEYFSEDVESRFLMFVLNIESLLPKSNIFDYVFKTDINKDVKFEHQEKRKELYSNIDILNEDMLTKINNHNKLLEELGEKHTRLMEEIGEKISNSYTKINTINSELSLVENDIEESEWKVDLNTHEEFIFNKIKQKLIIEKKLNYGSI